MALGPCRECGKHVSTEASTCPNCGVPQPVESDEEWAARIRRESDVSENTAEWALWVKRQLEANRKRANILADLRRRGVPNNEAVALLDVFRGEYRARKRASAYTDDGDGTGQQPRTSLLALGGAGLLFLGVFLPIVRVPMVGSLNYFRNGQGDGVVVLVLAVITVVAVLQEHYRWLWATGLGAFAMLVFTFVNFQMKMSSARTEMQRELSDNPFAGLGEVMMESVQLEWGWVVLVTGAGLITAAAWQATLE